MQTVAKNGTKIPVNNIIFDPNIVSNYNNTNTMPIDNTRVNIPITKVIPINPIIQKFNTNNNTSTIKSKNNVESDYIKNKRLKIQEEIENPGFITQFGEALQLPLRYLANPFKLLGDITNTINPNAPINSLFPNTQQDRYNYRKKTLDPFIDNNERISNIQTEVLPLVTNSLINAGTLELGALFNGSLPRSFIPLVETGSKANLMADLLQIAQTDTDKLKKLDPSTIKDLLMNMLSMPAKLDNFNAQDILYKINN